MEHSDVVLAELLDESLELSTVELCQRCGVQGEWIATLVGEGVLEPRAGAAVPDWRFPATAVTRVQVTLRLQRDLGVNLAGAALALDLLGEIRALQDQLLRGTRPTADDASAKRGAGLP
jgi:chaperone modulatory protein CbpM